MTNEKRQEKAWFVIFIDGTWSGGFSTFGDARDVQKSRGGPSKAQIVQGRWFDLGGQS